MTTVSGLDETGRSAPIRSPMTKDATTIAIVPIPRINRSFLGPKTDWTARQVLSAYACRWAIECTFEFCKQFLGLEDPANRLPKA